ncbi:PAAR domain-containing protein [Trinickia sp. LjRoot230]|uniref:PAAR domain-containing protein n=1 Tax=Trinickia sp. LjRoot230 TaxID=3342288 RepID=UPI003ECEE207
MRKAAIRHGDPTTTGGLVMAFSSTIHDEGKKVALSGDEASCGNCKGAFKIFGTGRGMSEKGRDVVVDGDLVLCPCKKNRVIVGRNPGIFLETRTEAAGAGSGGAPMQAGDRIYDEQVAVASSAALEGYPYLIEAIDGRTIAGRLDSNGRLPRVYSDASGAYSVHWGDEALAKQEGLANAE